MSISVSCDSCGKQLKVKDDAAGKRVKCPGCGKAVQIPQSDDVMDAEADDDNPFAGGDISSDGPDYDRKPCPACGEMIVNTAAKCRFCGEIFDATLKKSSKAQSGKSGGNATDAAMTTGDWVVAILCSGIGCIAGIVWMIQGKPKGLKMFLVSLAVQVVVAIVQVIITAANKGQGQF